MTNDWPGGSYLALNRKYMVNMERAIIYTGCKYNTWKVLYLIPTEGEGIKKYGITYLTKHLEPFGNFSIRTVAILLVMYKFFVLVNEVDYHKKHIQSDLAMEKYWVTQCGWICLCMAVAMVTNINNFWKPFSYGVNIDHYEKLIDTREFP